MTSVSIIDLQHPSKSAFNGKPVWDWVNACALSELRRCEVMDGGPVEIWKDIAASSAEFLSGFVMGNDLKTAEFFRNVGVPTSSCPGLLSNERCPFCKVVHRQPVTKTLQTAAPASISEATVIFDTETTGMGKYDVVVELGYVIIGQCGELLREYSKLWSTDVPIAHRAFAVHGISQAAIKEVGADAATELKAFWDLCTKVKRLVAHNAAFDVRLLNQTADQVGVARCTRGVFCTMQGCKKRSVAERGPTCKNEDVYRFIGGHSVGVAHRALEDCRKTAFIYNHGRALKWW